MKKQQQSDIMELKTRARKQVPQVAFKEVGRNGVRIAFTTADYWGSMELLEAHGLKPLIYLDEYKTNPKKAIAEALLLINDPVPQQLKGLKFYSGGEGIDLDGSYNILRRQLKRGRGEFAKTVSIRAGPYPLSLHVRWSSDTIPSEAQFDLLAYIPPSYLASVVVGVKAKELAASKRA